VRVAKQVPHYRQPTENWTAHVAEAKREQREHDEWLSAHALAQASQVTRS
jgi:hypothetical protein